MLTKMLMQKKKWIAGIKYVGCEIVCVCFVHIKATMRKNGPRRMFGNSCLWEHLNFKMPPDFSQIHLFPNKLLILPIISNSNL